MSQRSIRVFAIGDLHGSWNSDDEAFYRESAADIVLWTGDLANSVTTQLLVAESLARLGETSFGILGNHDGASPLLAKTECVKARFATWFLSYGHAKRVQRLRDTLGKHDIGFERRDVPELNLSIIGLRSHSSGGYPTSFARTLRTVYGVTDLEESLRRSIHDVQADRLMLLGHNGPKGVGGERNSPFGIDWLSEGGDGGDQDYTDAICLAQEAGKTVMFAIAGHMHNHPLTEGCGDTSTRDPLGWLGGVPVLNACWNPRIEAESEGSRHYHYECSFSLDGTLEYIHRVAWRPRDGQQLRTVVYDSGAR